MSESLKIPPNLYIVVGQIVVNWAYIEMALDQCATVIYRRCDTTQLDPEIPVGIKRKLATLKKAFASTPELKAFREDAKELLRRATALVEKRHEPVHGAFLGIEPESGAFRFVKIDHKQAHRPVVKTERQFMELHTSAREMLDLAHDLAPFANRLIKNLNVK